MTALALALAFAVAAARPAPAPAPVKPPAAKKKKIDRTPKQGAPDRPIKINSDTFEVLSGNKQATWKGNVVAVREDMRMTCNSLVADYDDQQRIKKLTCSGQAYMRQAASPKGAPSEHQEREVWGEVAVFDNDTAVLTVTGSPRAREGPNTMHGERILFDTEADKLRVERVSMVIQTPPEKEPKK